MCVWQSYLIVVQFNNCINYLSHWRCGGPLSERLRAVRPEINDVFSHVQQQNANYSVILNDTVELTVFIQQFVFVSYCVRSIKVERNTLIVVRKNDIP